MKRILSVKTIEKKGEEVKLSGWVHSRRDHSKLIFIDLRDRSGLVQLVFLPSNQDCYKLADSLRSEWVIEVTGQVNKRPKGMINEKIPTGEVEIEVKTLKILNKAKTPPFEIAEEPVKDKKGVNEEIRLKYRYLDLRRQKMKRNLFVRHKVIKLIRDFMDKKGFVEVETPILTKSTPEGARDFLVPSRLYPGKFYALPQSPQQYKELLMAGGIERYFQIAHCLRDEDPRADRQPEHTQLDMEMSFVKRDDIMNLLEKLIIKIVLKSSEYFLSSGGSQKGKKLTFNPLKRLTYQESMKNYGTDKPDLRTNPKDSDELAFAWIIDFPLFAWDGTEKRYDPVHHMFVMPKKGYRKYLDSDPLKVISTQFDLVCNGYEICSGSIRIHTRKLQEKIFKLIGLGVEKGRKQFGHLLEAFDYGCPPHGGAAPGIDRLVMLLTGENNIREVIAFPKTGDARDLMMDVPSEAGPGQLKELGIKIES